MSGKVKLKEYNAKRDFKKTAEPAGAVYSNKSDRLAFVVQKHEASHLHYDIRLEVDGVMRSWACPKGPSFDPKVKRLAVEVEDHPVSYNEFEGTIPSGEYGGGTVMVWDYGYYTVDEAKAGDDPEEMMKEGIKKGKLSFSFHGQKLKGSFALVRTRNQTGKKAQWLLIKHKDEAANPDYDPVGEEAISAKSQRRMAEIEAGVSLKSDATKAGKNTRSKASATLPPREKAGKASATRHRSSAGAPYKKNQSRASVALAPMLVHLTSELPEGDDWVYEQKLDGVRLLAYADEKNWTVISRLGNDKSKQFPELGEGFKKLAKAAGGALILDGEVVAIDKKKKPLGFQFLQGRIHLDDSDAVKSEVEATPIEFYAFDILLAGDTSIASWPWNDRRKVLEQLFSAETFPLIKVSPVSDSAQEMKSKAEKGHWEGLLAKDAQSPYLPGTRTRNWLKWKVSQREELVIAGWTEPKGSRQHIGSLLLGYYNPKGEFLFAGHVGSGLNSKILKELHKKLQDLEQDASPFSKKTVTNDVAHWVEPKIVAEVKFPEWTSDKILRQGTFLGIRDDKKAEDIVLPREGALPVAVVTNTLQEEDEAVEIVPQSPKNGKKGVLNQKSLKADLGSITDEGHLRLAEGELRVTHLDKVIFPKDKITKRDLLQYYTVMADFILPWMKDRPLVMRRFPGGIDSKDFYQQAPDDDAPGRIMELKGDEGEIQRRFVGGDLQTLLYTVQMGCISYDPWHSRAHSLSTPDYTILDLDPVAGTSFETVRSVALACLDYMEEKGLRGAMKTSGATGLHIYLPLPPETSLEAGRLVAEIICTHIAQVHPHGTVERSVKKRKKGSVYLDSQQNFLSKSVAGVWAIRAKPGATVSTPISRKELESGVVPQDFNLKTVIADAKKRTKMWNDAMTEPVDLSALLPE